MICTDDSIKLELNSQDPIVDYYFDLIEKEIARQALVEEVFLLQVEKGKSKPPKRPPPKKRPIN